jgi:hypothetical protein
MLNKERFVLSDITRQAVQDYTMDIENSNKNMTISFSRKEWTGNAISIICKKYGISRKQTNNFSIIIIRS